MPDWTSSKLSIIDKGLPRKGEKTIADLGYRHAKDNFLLPPSGVTATMTVEEQKWAQVIHQGKAKCRAILGTVSSTSFMHMQRSLIC